MGYLDFIINSTNYRRLYNLTNYCCYLTCPCYIRSFCRSRLLARPPSPPASTSWSSSPPTTQPPVFTFLNRFFVCPFMFLCFFLIYLSVLSSCGGSIYFFFSIMYIYLYIYQGHGRHAEEAAGCSQLPRHRDQSPLQQQDSQPE